LAVKDLKVGYFIKDFSKNLVLGSTYLLKQFPIGTYLSMLELSNGKGIQIVRAAGCKAQILSRTNNFLSIALPSGKIRIFPNDCKAVYGIIGMNIKKAIIKLKAGFNRRVNIRPTVRGVAMNPIDHPHGGGQGKNSGGRKMSVSPWSKYTKGMKSKKKRVQLCYVKTLNLKKNKNDKIQMERSLF
jgi:large subunit ribosomal protein L2